jgi:hypothetical protein
MTSIFMKNHKEIALNAHREVSFDKKLIIFISYFNSVNI